MAVPGGETLGGLGGKANYGVSLKMEDGVIRSGGTFDCPSEKVAFGSPSEKKYNQAKYIMNVIGGRALRGNNPQSEYGLRKAAYLCEISVRSRICCGQSGIFIL